MVDLRGKAFHIVTSNIARKTREQAHAADQSERFVATKLLPVVADDLEAAILILRAVALNAIEDDRAGGGPLRQAEEEAR